MATSSNSTVYSLTKELLPPSSIDHVQPARLTDPNSLDLVVARGTLLQIYRIKEEYLKFDTTDSMSMEEEQQDLGLPGIVAHNDEQPPRIARLELKQQMRLDSPIASVGVVRTCVSVGAANMDSLLLCFKDAKLSLLEYSPAQERLVTVSIHNYEQPDLKWNAAMDRALPQIRMDPQSRCAAMRVYNDNLAILPFKQQDTSIAAVNNDEQSAKFPFLPSFVLQFTSIDPSIKNVIDFAFLFGYVEPALAIMYEPFQTWSGRLSERKDTVAVVVISLDVLQRKYPILYRIDKLPFNCTYLHPVPPPVGGLLIVSHNALIHTDQMNAPGVACIVNPYFDMESTLKNNSKIPMTGESVASTPIPRSIYYSQGSVVDLKELGISFDGSYSMFLSPDVLLVILRDGEMVQCNLIGDEGGGRSWKRRKGGVRSMSIHRLGVRTTSPCGLVPISASHISSESDGTFHGKHGTILHYGYLFASSRCDDAQLIQYSEFVEREKSDAVQDASMNDAFEAIDDYGEDELDMELYGDSTDKSSKVKKNSGNSIVAAVGSSSVSEKIASTFRFRICDALLVTSPFRDITVGQPTVYSSHPFSPTNPSCDLEVVGVSGHGVHGSIVILHRNVRPIIVSSFEMSDVDEMWSVRCSSVRKRALQAGEDVFHRYMFLSKADATSILSTGEEFTESSGGDFHCDGPSVYVGTLLEETAIIQVFPNGVILLDSEGVRIQTIKVGNQDQWIVLCSVQEPYVGLLLNNGDLLVYVTDATSRHLNRIKHLTGESVSTCSLYCDFTGSDIFPTNKEAFKTHAHFIQKQNKQKMHTALRVGQPKESAKENVPDSDEDIYGGDEELEGIYGNDEEMGGIYGDEAMEEAQDEIIPQDVQIEEPVEDAVKLNEFNVSQVGADATGYSASKEPSFWCVITTEAGHLRIFGLPDFQEVFAFPHFSSLPSVVADRPGFVNDPEVSNVQSNTEDEGAKKQDRDNALDEILMVNLGRDESCQIAYLVGKTTKQDLVIYKTFIFPTILDDDEGTPLSTTISTDAATKQPAVSLSDLEKRLAVRFVRIKHDQITREPQFYTDTEGDKLHLIQEPPRPPTFLKKSHLKPFEGIGSSTSFMYSGVVVTGSRPCWIMVAKGHHGSKLELEILEPEGEDVVFKPSLNANGSNAVRLHPMAIDGAVKCFAPLHNVNVRNGFAYINTHGSLRICQLPEQFNFDNDWPCCKVPLHRSAHKLTCHYSSETYVMATSKMLPFSFAKAQYAAAVAFGVIEEGQALPDSEKKITGIRDLTEFETGMYFPLVEKFQLELVSPVTWETVDIIDVPEAEHVVCVQAVELSSKETATGKKLYVAVGTGFMRSEDLTSRGRLLLYDVIDVVPEPNNPQTNHKFKQVFATEDKSPFSAICAVNGYLLAAVGPKIIMFELEDGELNGTAFLDVNLYVVSMQAVKNLIMVSDISKSVWFVAYQEEPAKLILLGKDLHPMQIFNSEFLIDDGALSMLVCDGEKNLHTMSYMPYNVQSMGGQRLIRRGEMQLGKHVSKMVRLKRKALIRNETIVASKQHMVVSGTFEGAIVVTTPVPEKLYRRLYGLYSRMVTNLQHLAGLNPRGSKQVSLRVRPLGVSGAMMGPPGPKGILDGDLLFEYASLSGPQQRELAKAIGSNEDRLMDDLLEVIAGTDYF